MPHNDDAKLPDFHFEVEQLNKARATVKITADKEFISRASNRLRPYKNLPNRMRPVLERMADYVRITMIPQTFKKEGPGWRPLARRTVAERIQAGYGGRHPILIRSGDLFNELTEKSHPKHIEIIKTGKNARIEIGGSSTKFIENQLGRSEARLPPRPMIPGTGNIPITDRDRIAMKSIVLNAVRERLR